MFSLSILCNPRTQNKLRTCKKKYVANAFRGIFTKNSHTSKYFVSFGSHFLPFFVNLNLNPPFSDITWCSIWTHVSTCCTVLVEANELIRMFFVDSCDSMALTLQGQGCKYKILWRPNWLNRYEYCIWSIYSAFWSSHGGKSAARAFYNFLCVVFVFCLFCVHGKEGLYWLRPFLWKWPWMTTSKKPSIVIQRY